MTRRAGTCVGNGRVSWADAVGISYLELLSGAGQHGHDHLVLHGRGVGVVVPEGAEVSQGGKKVLTRLRFAGGEDESARS